MGMTDGVFTAENSLMAKLVAIKTRTAFDAKDEIKAIPLEASLVAANLAVFSFYFRFRKI